MDAGSNVTFNCRPCFFLVLEAVSDPGDAPIPRLHRVYDLRPARYVCYPYVPTLPHIVFKAVLMAATGQWDAGNPWSNPGCPTGSCLRSHVNWTETHNALAMITKAGVPANKVLMGVATYGRSFKMAQAGCDGPNCLFLGDRDNSQAKKGRCTDTAGYLANAEIFEQIDKGYTRRWADSSTRANYLVYEGSCPYSTCCSHRDDQATY